MAKKLKKNGLIRYICENCSGLMFSVFKDTNDLADQENQIIFKKHLSIKAKEIPRYTCQYCGTTHKGYYKDNGLDIDFRPLIKNETRGK